MTEIFKTAYEAGVHQILDISSFIASRGLRVSYIAAIHYESERANSDIPNRCKYVALRYAQLP
jgi:hypothetical protein